MNFEPMCDGALVTCSGLVWQFGRSQPRLFLAEALNKLTPPLCVQKTTRPLVRAGRCCPTSGGKRSQSTGGTAVREKHRAQGARTFSTQLRRPDMSSIDYTSPREAA